MSDESKVQQRYLEHLERLKNFRLMDDDFMTKCFEDNVECVELVLRIILDKQDLQVVEAKTQVFVANLANRSVRLDVLATDSTGKKYNIEMQKADSGAGYRRARYNSSMLDLNLLQKSEDFNKLLETYVIFITENDVIGQGLPLYEIERCILQTKEIIDDGEHIIYVNGAWRDETPLGMLMQDLIATDPNSMHYDLLAKCVDYYKNSKEGKAVMCKVMEDMWNQALIEGRQEGRKEGRQEGRQEGMYETRRENALRMLAAGTLTLEQIADFSGLSLEEVKQLKNEKTA